MVIVTRVGSCAIYALVNVYLDSVIAHYFDSVTLRRHGPVRVVSIRSILNRFLRSRYVEALFHVIGSNLCNLYFVDRTANNFPRQIAGKALEICI